MHGEKCLKDVEERCGAECVGAWKVEGHGRELHARVLVGVGAAGGGLHLVVVSLGFSL